MQDHHADVPACRHEPDPLIETARGIAGSDAQAEGGNPHHSRPLDEVTQECRAHALVTKRGSTAMESSGISWDTNPYPRSLSAQKRNHAAPTSRSSRTAI